MRFRWVSGLVVLGCLAVPGASQAQNTGRIECARTDGYIYLYSSLTTLDVRSTLQCGEIVQISGNYDSYYGVRTTKGEVGYVPLSSVVLLKDRPGTGLPASDGPSRERVHYDNGPSPNPETSRASSIGFGFPKDFPIRVGLRQTLSSSTAHVGDSLDFEVVANVELEGVIVIAKGAKATGVVTGVDIKKRFGHNGKVDFNIKSVEMANREALPVRCFQEVTGASATSSDVVVAISAGKDAAIPIGTEFSALVEQDTNLNREAFLHAVNASPAPVKPTAATPVTPKN